MTAFSALIISPKSRELLVVRKAPNTTRTVYLSYPGRDLNIGQAYLDSSEVFEIGRKTYRRSHSPNSGVQKGTGHGPALYYGLSLFAFSEFEDAGIASSDGGSGHSTRSADANAFWANAVKYGMAEETTIEGDLEEDTYEFDPDEYLSDMVDCEFVGDDECVGIYSVSTRHNTVVTYEKGGGEVEAQYMPADNVVEAGLVLDWQSGHPTLDLDVPPADVLAGLDLSECRDVRVVEDIIGYVKAEGLDLDYIENMLSKLPPDIYSTAVRQLKLPFTPNRRGLRRNGSVEREVSKVWKDFYGDLAKI